MLELHDRNATHQFTNQLIAPVIHQIWEDRFDNKTNFKQIELFRILNPNLDFKLFDNYQREFYIREYWGDHPIYPIFTGFQFGPMKADIFGYCLLFERGGFYFGISKGCSVPLGSLLESSSSALISCESHDCALPPNLVLSNRLQYAEKQVLQWGMGFA